MVWNSELDLSNQRRKPRQLVMGECPHKAFRHKEMVGGYFSRVFNGIKRTRLFFLSALVALVSFAGRSVGVVTPGPGRPYKGELWALSDTAEVSWP
jgi:hypothetical protein